jgi:hypothetical protein
MRSRFRPALIVALAIPAAGFCQTVGPKFSLTISLPQSVVKSASKVELDITKKNISEHDLMCETVVGTAEEDYDVIATDGEGKPAVETKYGRKIHGKEPYKGTSRSSFIRTLKPGEEVQEHLFVNRIYDLSQPGKFTIQVQVPIYANDADAKSHRPTYVKSNAVTVTITN